MKEKLFISYAHANYDKVEIIKHELANNSMFEPIVVADKRKPNHSLVKLVKENISSAYCIIPILSPQSYNAQWINQEIGYAEGLGVQVIPIVESRVLNDLKGFVHKQNQCPYLYTARAGLFIHDENAEFTDSVKKLIMDLEQEYKKNLDNQVEAITKGDESFFYNSGPMEFRKFIGTIARTGEKCPETGIWKTNKKPATFIPFNQGTKMPEYEGRPIIWKLVSYN